MTDQTAEHVVGEIRWILGIDGDADVIAHVRRVFDLTTDQEETIGVLQGGHDVALAEIDRMTGDLNLIRRHVGEHVAGLPIEVRNKYLMVVIPTIVDHALGDTISGGEEAYALIERS